MKSIAFVIPWSGKLPDYFRIWLLTCKNNSSIDFLLFTDDKTEYDFPDNVKVHYFSTEGLKNIFRKNFDFQITIDKPYKFCDFRPAYGEIFSDWLKEYDFWGHCDIDLLWGDIRKFLTDEILEKYKRIYTRGHCCLYRNVPEVNAWYRLLPRQGYQEYKKVFTTNDSCCFDEWGGHCGGGISCIIHANGIEVYDSTDMADLAVNRAVFKINRREDIPVTCQTYFKYENGRVTACYRNEECAEFLYVHFQKRAPKVVDGIYDDCLYLIPPNIITSEYKHRKLFDLVKFDFDKVVNKIRRMAKR